MDRYTYPDFSNSALVTIDLQKDFLDGQSLEIPGTSQILPNVKKLLDSYREKNKNIIHIIRIYKANGDNVDLCRKELIDNGSEFLFENSPGAELAQELFDDVEIHLDFDLLLNGEIQKISDNEVFIYKSRWGAFYKTLLENHLKNLSVNTLVFTGCNYPNCTRTSIYEASERDFKIAVVKDAVSGLYEQGLTEMMNIGVFIEDTGNIINLVTA